MLHAAMHQSPESVEPFVLGGSQPQGEPCGSSGYRWERVVYAGLWSAIVLGVWLRIESPAQAPLWEDEFWTIHRTDGSLKATVLDLRESPFPPLHYILVWAWRAFWGSSSIGCVRWVSIFAGLAGILALYRVWGAIAGQCVGLWAAALVSLSAFHLGYSLDAKMYAAVWMWSALACGLFLQTVLDGRRTRDFVLLGLANGCLMLTSYVGVVALAIQALFAAFWFLRYPVLRRRLLLCLFSTLTGILPLILWIEYALRAAANRTAGQWMPAAELAGLPVDLFRLLCLWSAGIWMGDFQARGEWSHVFLAVAPAVSACSLLVIAAHAWNVLRKPADTGMVAWDASEDDIPFCRTKAVLLFTLVWLLLPILGNAVFSLTIYSLWGVPRYLAGCAPALPLLSAMAIAGQVQNRGAVLFGAVLIAVNALAIIYAANVQSRVPWHEACRAVDVALKSMGDARPSEQVYIGCFGIQGHYINPMVVNQQLRVEAGAPNAFCHLFDRNAARQHSLLFAVVKSRNGGAASRDAVAQRLPEHARVPIYSTTSSEERYSCLPTPFELNTVEVWLCRNPTP